MGEDARSGAGKASTSRLFSSDAHARQSYSNVAKPNAVLSPPIAAGMVGKPSRAQAARSGFEAKGRSREVRAFCAFAATLLFYVH